MDACVSFHKFCQIRTPEFTGDFAEFKPLFKKGTMIYGNYWYHLKVSNSQSIEIVSQPIYSRVAGQREPTRT